MTFFGVCVKLNEKVQLSLPPNSADSELLHISTIVLGTVPKSDERFLVHIADAEGKEYVAAALDARHSSQSVDLYVPVMTTVRLSGPASSKQEVHLTGYSEPIVMSEDEDDMEGTSDEEGAEVLDVENLSKSFRETLSKVGKKGTEKSTETSSDDSESGSGEEEDDEEESSGSEMGDASEEETTAPHAAAEESSDEEDEEESDDEGSDASESESEESEAEAPVEVPAKKQSSKKSAPEPVTKTASKKEESKKEESKKEESKKEESKKEESKKDESKKRKLQAQPEGAPASKKAAANTPESTFEAAIITFMKTQGNSCKISAIGARVKKPSELKATKLGAFLRERASVFTIAGDNVSLKK